MNISIFTWVNAFLWFNLVAAACVILRRRGGLFLRLGPWPLILALTAAILRLLAPVALPSAKVVYSQTILPAFQDFARLSLPFGSPGDILLLCWGTGTLCCVCRLIFDLRRDDAAIKGCVLPPGQRIQAVVSRVAGTKCRVVLSPQAAVPMAAGFFTPILILPTYVSDFSEQELTYIIQHEWRHLRHHDAWIKLTAEVFVCLFWWNPLVHLLREDMAQFLEIRCDLSVAKNLSSEEKAAYLQTILKSASQETHNGFTSLSPRLSGSSNSADIRQRFQMVAKRKRKQGLWAGLAWAAGIIATGVLSMGIVVLPYGLPSEDMVIHEGLDHPVIEERITRSPLYCSDSAQSIPDTARDSSRLTVYKTSSAEFMVISSSTVDEETIQYRRITDHSQENLIWSTTYRRWTAE